MVEITAAQEWDPQVAAPNGAPEGLSVAAADSGALPVPRRFRLHVLASVALAIGMIVVATAWGTTGTAPSAYASKVATGTARSAGAPTVAAPTVTGPVAPAGVATTTTTAPHTGTTTGTAPAAAPTTTSTVPVPTVTAAVAPAPAVAAPSAAPSIAAMVAEVEAAGIVPGAGWSWSTGDTAGQCAFPTGSGQASGCTSWSSGTVHTVFDGTPTLSLVAHEVANAETERYALPALLHEVGDADAGTSWSPTDAVASCLVAHFLGHQDNAAGSWQCPSSLAASVAAHIHDTIVTTQITAICGSTSGVASVLTFAAGTGTLTVTSPAGPQTAASGASITVSGVGTFTAKDVGGTATVTGVCHG